MNILYLMVPLSLLLGTVFVVAFVRSARSGQYDDLVTPANRILIEELRSQKIQEEKNER